MTFHSRYIALAVLAALLTSVSPRLAPGEQAQGKIPERSQIDPKYTWDLTALYSSREGWESDFKVCEKSVAALADMKGKASKSPEGLLAYLTASADLSVKFSRIAVYASLLKDQDTRQPEPQAMYDRAMSLYVKLGEASS